MCSTVGFGVPNLGSDIESEKSLHVLNYEQTAEARFHWHLICSEDSRLAFVSADNSIVGKYFFSCPKMDRSFSSTSVSCQLES